MSENLDAIEKELNRRLIARRQSFDSILALLPRVSCADGFSVSIQAGQYLYCEPRDDEGPWRSVELGFPTAPMPTLADYCESESPETATETVWGYVPMREVAAVLATHGGLSAEQDA